MNPSFSFVRRASAVLCLLLAVLMLFPLSGCGNTADNKTSTVVVDGIQAVTLKPSANGHTKDELTVKVTLTDEFCNAADRSDRIYLFELPSYMDTPAVGQVLKAGDLTAPTDPKKVKKSIEFSLPLFDGSRTRLFSRFVIAKGPEVSGKNPVPAEDIAYTVIDTAAIGNVQDYTQTDTLSIKGQPSKKGLQVTADTLPMDAQALTPSHVILEVQLEALLLKEYREDAIHFVHNGTSRYLRKSGVDALDSQIKAYSDAGATVYLRFTLHAPADAEHAAELPDNLYMATLLDEKKQYAVNMDDEKTAQLMEGFFAFMADRYTRVDRAYGTAARFIIGHGVNGQNNWSTGASADKVADYERLLRVADTALRSRCPEGRVYVSLDSNWNRVAGEAEVFLANLQTTAYAQGDYPWQIAMGLSADSDTIWRADSTQNETATALSVNNLLLLERTLKTPRYQYLEAETRRVLLTDLDIPGGETTDSQRRQAASFVYAYCKALESDICEAVFCSQSILSQPTSLLGQVFDIIDTNQSKSATDLAINVIGASASFDSLYQSVKSKLPALTMTSGNVTTAAGDTLRRGCDELCAFNDLGGLCGFEAAGRIEKMELLVDDSLGRSKLYVTTQPTSEQAGITVRLSAQELMGVKELSAPIHAGTGSTPGKVTLRMVRYADDTSRGMVVYEATTESLSNQNWQTVTFKVGEFTSKLKKNDQVQLTISMQGGSTATASDMGLGGLYVYPKASSFSLGTTLVSVSVVLGVTALAVLAAVLWRRKQRPAPVPVSPTDTPDEV